MLKSIIVVGCIVYIILSLYLYLTQDSKIFNFSIVEKRRPAVLNECENCKEVMLKVDNAVLSGVYLENNSKKLIIYFGGNSDDATDFIKLLKNQSKYNVVAFNYRGNALSSGIPSEKNLFEDALRIYDTYAKDKIVYVVGRSLGSGVAVYLSTKRDIKKLILITPYDSIENVAKERYPFLPVLLLLRYKFNSKDYIKNSKAPIVIFMVKDDKVVSNKRTKNLIKYIKNPFEIKEFSNTTHGDILLDKEFQQEFLNSLL